MRGKPRPRPLAGLAAPAGRRRGAEYPRDARTAAAYVGFLVKAIEALQQRGIESFVLIHETKEDGLLVEQLKQGLVRELPVIEEEDSLAIKGLIWGLVRCPRR